MCAPCSVHLFVCLCGICLARPFSLLVLHSVGFSIYHCTDHSRSFFPKCTSLTSLHLVLSAHTFCRQCTDFTLCPHKATTEFFFNISIFYPSPIHSSLILSLNPSLPPSLTCPPLPHPSHLPEVDRQIQGDVFKMASEVGEPVPGLPCQWAPLPLQRGPSMRHHGPAVLSPAAGRRLCRLRLQNEDAAQPAVTMGRG